MRGKTGFLALAVVALMVNACGGGGGNSSASTQTVSTPPPASGGGSPATVPIIVNVATQPVSGIDINVSSPASGTPPNAEVLGVSALGSGGSASDVGATISRGTTMKVLLFGPGLDGSMTVTIGGPPADISFSNVRSITATDKTPGIAFDATVSGSAALGARTVILTATNGDVTTFTGGLEVVP